MTGNNTQNNSNVYKTDFARSLGFNCMRNFRKVVKAIAQDPDNKLKVTRNHYFTPKEQKILNEELRG
jgi:hypothetical protein